MVNRFIGKVYGPLVVLVNAALLVELAADLYAKWKERKAAKQTTAVTATEEEPETEDE